MENRPPLARHAAALLLASSLTAGLTGCKKDEAKSADAPATPAAVPAAKADQSYSFDGITFQYPGDWKVKTNDAAKGVEVVGPTDGNWETNLFFSIETNKEEVALDELITQNQQLLAARKQNFTARNNQQNDHPNGFKYARIEYENTSEAGDTPLRQWSVLIPLTGKKYLQVQCSAAAASWEKYQTTFEKVINSIKLPK